LIKETEAIIDVERKKLKQKQGKSQEEMEALVDITITSKLTGDGKDAWKDVPILFADNKQRYSRSASNSGANNKNGILEMNKQIQQNTGVQNQARQFEQRATILELQTKERDSELVLLRNDQQSLQLGTSRVQYQIAKSDSKINSLQSKNQEQKLKIISLEYQLKEKDNTMNSLENEKKTLSTANQFIIEMVETQKSLLQSKINEMELLRQNMERQLADEKKRNEVLEHEIRALKRERAQDQTSTSLLSNDRTNPTNVGSNRGGDDDSAQNNINYDSELDNTEERQDDEVNDINYDTPSEDGDK
jgi:hypothetical protein